MLRQLSKVSEKAECTPVSSILLVLLSLLFASLASFIARIERCICPWAVFLRSLLLLFLRSTTRMWIMKYCCLSKETALEENEVISVFPRQMFDVYFLDAVHWSNIARIVHLCFGDLDLVWEGNNIVKNRKSDGLIKPILLVIIFFQKSFISDSASVHVETVEENNTCSRSQLFLTQ